MLKWSLGCSMAAVLAVSTSGAVAQPVAQKPHTGDDYSAFTGTPETLIRVIRHVEETTGGRVLDIRFSSVDGEPGYSVVVDQGGQVLFERLVREDGQLVPIVERDRPTSMLRWRARRDVKLAEHARVSLADAVMKAENQSNGAPAVAAGLATSASDADNSVVTYNVLVWRGGETHRVAVDDQTGAIIENPDEL